MSYGYTNRGELGTVTDWTTAVTTYTYDPTDRLTGIALPNGVSTTLGYDLADRLTAITHATGGINLEALQYVLDAAGNRTSMTDSTGTTTWGYNVLDRPTGLSGPTTASCVYNGDGLRVSKTVGGTTTNYVWDPTGLPVVLADGTEYVWGEDVCSRRRAGSAAIARRMPISRGYPPNGPAHPGRPAGRVGRGA